jgi:glycerol-3-phosphate cytidylyltransferase-like family protein
MPRRKRITLSGGFDPLYVAHIDMINDVAKYGDVIMILNSDNWLRMKKGWAFMS